MKTLRYKLIGRRRQYNAYFEILEDLCSMKSSKQKDEIDLISLLKSE